MSEHVCHQFVFSKMYFKSSLSLSPSQTNPSLYPVTPDPKAAYHYDTVNVFVTALIEMESNSGIFEPKTLIESIRDVNIDGMSGTISFSGNDLATSRVFELYGVYEGNWVLAGNYSSGTFTETDEFVWMSCGGTWQPSIMLIMIGFAFHLFHL
jgi:hypothetical protein